MTLVRLHAVVERARDARLNLAPGLPLLVIKEVNGSHAADLVMSLFPRSKMIFLIRDGRDVLDSMIDANRPGGWAGRRQWSHPGFESEGERLEFVLENARNWTARINACARAFEAHDPELRMRVRYEDLLADTTSGLQRIAAWLGLPSGPKRMESIAAQHSFGALPEEARGPGRLTRAATPGAWREGLTPEEQRTADEVMGPTLEQLGYAR